jgi:hypothetical protein
VSAIECHAANEESGDLVEEEVAVFEEPIRETTAENQNKLAKNRALIDGNKL